MSLSLDSYLAAPRVYYIPFGKGRNDSITARIKEADEFIRQAHKAKLLGVGDSIVILGAGATGISAALTAAELGIRSHVADSADGLFKLQASCTTRWVDPYQYDWPEAHWQNVEFPANPPDTIETKLSWHADWASEIAARWQWQMKDHPEFSLVDLQLVARFETGGFKDFGSVLDFYFKNSPLEGIKYKFILITTSIAREKVTKDTFFGFSFWESDPFHRQHLGLPKDKPQQVLISGGGDGALQDFIRIATGRKSAREVIDRFTESFQADPGAALGLAAWFEGLTAAVGTAGGDPATIHNACQLKVEELFRDHEASVKSGCRRILAFPLTAPHFIRLVHEKTFFTRCYLLNRFLVLLLSAYIKHKTGESCLLPESRIKQIRPLSKHAPAKDAWESFERPYEVELEGVHAGSLLPTIIVLRHGAISFVDLDA